MMLSCPLMVKNESANIADCLRSLRPIADEIVVLDTGSTDGTPDICKGLADRVLFSSRFGPKTPPEDFHFADARNEVLAACSGDWVLSVDADERAECDPAALRLWLSQGNVRNAFVPMRYEHKRGHLSYIPRLFAREGTKWTGRYHDVPGPWDHAHEAKVPQSVLMLLNTSKPTQEKNLRNVQLLKREMFEDEGRISETTLQLADAYRMLGPAYYPEAIGHYELMLTALGNNRPAVLPYVITVLADCYLKVGVVGKALDLCTRVMREHPLYQRGYLVAANCHKRLRQWDLAIAYYQRALDIDDPEPMHPYIDEPISRENIENAVMLCDGMLRKPQTGKPDWRYGTHIPALAGLKAVFDFRTVTEIGGGGWSTPWLRAHADKVTTSEQSPTWARRIGHEPPHVVHCPELGIRNTDTRETLSPATYEALLDYLGRLPAADLLFVDGCIAERQPAIDILADKCKAVVYHDADYSGYYTWRPDPEKWRHVVIDTLSPHTGIAWKNDLGISPDAVREAVAKEMDKFIREETC